ncbi:hypothetical protein [Kribbella shirazensis]|uniref:Uncharacterized protein n=1 Tax=Kribbella shirazensis TaxID=1105143 RepID=A0A7X6A2B8_9ACTN|nr:hypothetical protein [Kribbella shirazensis]NIK59121.1 hypothetical protein [Kribbella shirazensis]
MRFRRTAGVVVGIAVPALGSGPAAGSDEAQFVPGESNVVPATARPATDVGRTALGTAAAPFYACPGFSGLDAQNPLANQYADKFTWKPYAPYTVGNGGGNINWSLNPYKNASLYMWFHSLRWIGQGVIAASNGDLTALTRVNTIAYDWYREAWNQS